MAIAPGGPILPPRRPPAPHVEASVALVAGVAIHTATAVLDAPAVALEHIAEGAFDDLHPPDPAPTPTPTPTPTEIEQRAEALRRWLDSATGPDFGGSPGPEDDDPN